MAYLEELLPMFREGAKIRRKIWETYPQWICIKDEGGILFDVSEIEADDWELYEEPIDWDYIIKNRCPCWVWNKGYEFRKAVFLRSKENDYFLDDGGIYWDYCRPVRRDEVTFYEDWNRE